MLDNLIYKIFKLFLSVEEDQSKDLNNPRKILIIRQHNQLGDLLSVVPLFRAIKEKYPKVELKVLLGIQNYQGLIKNRYIDEYFVFNKKKLFNPYYFIKLKKFLRNNYDVVIVPVTVSISFTSNLLSALSDAPIKIGPGELNGKKNKSYFFFNRRIDINWAKYPDSNVAEHGLEILKPFGISTKNFKSEINFDNDDLAYAKNYLETLGVKKGQKIIGLHVGAGKAQNRWSLKKYCELIIELKQLCNPVFYLTGSKNDLEEIKYVQENSTEHLEPFIDKTIPQVAALISISSLFITNDTGIMHCAGATETPQISIFGPTNPFNWAPVGKNKLFLRNSDLIDDVSVNEVLEKAKLFLNNLK